MPNNDWKGTFRLLAAASAAVLLAACGGGGGGGAAFGLGVAPPPPPPPAASPPGQSLVCDESLKTAFKPDANTTVVAVKAFKKDDALVLSGAAVAGTAKAAAELCMVKLVVGPGNPGPADAPSTSPGIGIEIWMPAKSAWNDRIHALGGGGWQGGDHSSAKSVAAADAAAVAGTEGAVSSSTDTGHSTSSGAFAMDPDGTINQALWTDFASRAIHEQAVKTKALTAAYYGRPAKFAYFEGGSTGGRQALNLAQNNPSDYDGIVSGYPAINWTKFITGELYPQLVYQRDLGGVPLTNQQVDLVSNAAISACDMVGGQHLGYILDPSACKYDPTQDKAVLCQLDGGTNTTSACVTQVQATVMNKIWYGMTTDGSVPSPSADIGWGQDPTGSQRWFGNSRGTSLYGMNLFGFGLSGVDGPVGLTSDLVALELQNPTIADPGFINATGNGQSGWKSLSYAQLSNAFDRGVALQPLFGEINTDNPDLSAFKARGGKILHYHGLSDEVIFPQGSINYYTRVLSRMGGLSEVQPFYRLFLVPGYGHSSPNGTANPFATPPVPAANQMYSVMVNWVENGVAPDQIIVSSPPGSAKPISQPLCAYPKKASFGSGDPLAASSYSCK